MERRCYMCSALPDVEVVTRNLDLMLSCRRHIPKDAYEIWEPPIYL